MPQEYLDVAEVDALLQQVGGKAVPEGMGCGVFGNARFIKGPAEDVLDTGGAVLFPLWSLEKPGIGFIFDVVSAQLLQETV